MEVSSATLRPSCSFALLRAPKDAIRNRASSLASPRNLTRNGSLSRIFLAKPIALRRSRSSVASAAVSDTAPALGNFNGQSTSVSDSSDSGEESGDADCLDDQKMMRVCDKLIDIFMVDKPNPSDWRRLLAFSKEWENLRPHFYRRCQVRADSEDDPGKKHNFLKLARKLKEVDEDIQRHNELLNVIKDRSDEINEIVSRRRKDFTQEFFVHLNTVAESCHDNPAEQNAIAKLGNSCLAAVQAYDSVTESKEAIKSAELKLQDIINSPSLEAACKKIDTLAEKNQLDSALVLMLTKAWSAAKETNMMKDEVKDILYHLYTTARGNLQKQMPKEIRIIKYLLMIEDTDERLSRLNDAFTPGEELETKDVDYLYTTPLELHTWMKMIIDSYHFSSEGTLIREARDLMNPKIIQKLEELKKVIENKFM